MPSLPSDAREVSPWRNTGAWLPCYHWVDRGPSLPGRLGHRSGVVDVFRAFARYLGGLRVPEPLPARIAAIVKEVAAALPDTFPCAVGHSDFSPRNGFVGPAGCIAVAAPMPWWRVPIYDGLETFLTTMRCIGPQLASHVGPRRRHALPLRRGVLPSVLRWPAWSPTHRRLGWPQRRLSTVQWITST